tara:strand:+ start:375 stop:896 length:522 start_codon:yes stop_codon:yes gene_type:complete
MSIIKIFILKTLIVLFFSINFSFAEELKKVGKFKDWETLVLLKENQIICFAQSKPVLQSPKTNKRDAKIFVTFRPNKKIVNEISITSGYDYNTQNSVMAKSGKKKYKFENIKDNFAWINHTNNDPIEAKMIKTMKKGSRIMITGYNKSGSQTIDHYSLLGFTKAYNAAKKSCT